jgi:hypothetical protein
MKRLVPVLCVFALVAIACGKEASLVPVITSGPTFAPTTPTPTAVVTFEPFVTPTPTEEPLITPTPTPVPLTTPAPTHTPKPKPTEGPNSFMNHTPTPGFQPPDAYLRTSSQELKGLITEYNWQTSPTKRSYYEDPTPDPSDSIGVSSDSNLKILFARTGQPSRVFARYRTSADANANSTAVPVTQQNPAIVQGPFPSGTIWLDVFSNWPQGDVEHTYKLNVS